MKKYNRTDTNVTQIRKATTPERDMSFEEQAKRQQVVKRMFNNLYPEKKLRI